MKMTTERRNRIVEQNLWCVDAIIRQNELLLRAAHLEYDDVYQELSMRLICAVSQYVPQKGNIHMLAAQTGAVGLYGGKQALWVT